MDIAKVLGTEEDLAFGLGTVVQNRNGVDETRNEINAGTIPYTDKISVADKLDTMMNASTMQAMLEGITLRNNLGTWNANQGTPLIGNKDLGSTYTIENSGKILAREFGDLTTVLKDVVDGDRLILGNGAWYLDRLATRVPISGLNIPYADPHGFLTSNTLEEAVSEVIGAATLYGQFNAIYHGALLAPPALHPTSVNNMCAGDMYFDLDKGYLMVWDGTQWLDPRQQAMASVTVIDTITYTTNSTNLTQGNTLAGPADNGILPFDVITDPTAVRVYDNGILVTQGVGYDYTVDMVGKAIVFNDPIAFGHTITVDVMVSPNQLRPGGVEAKKLVNIELQFDGAKTDFDLGVTVNKAEELVISLDGVVQEPGVDYTFDTFIKQIRFLEPPKAGQRFWGISYASTGVASSSSSASVILRNSSQPYQPSGTEGDLTMTYSPSLDRKIDFYMNGQWNTYMSWDEILQAIAAGSLFKGNISELPVNGMIVGSTLPQVSPGNTGHYYISAEAFDIAGATGTNSALNGIHVEPGWWLQSSGDAAVGTLGGWQLIKSDILSKARADKLYDLEPWLDDDWEIGSVVLDAGMLFRANRAVTAGDVMPHFLSSNYTAGIDYGTNAIVHDPSDPTKFLIANKDVLSAPLPIELADWDAYVNPWTRLPLPTNHASAIVPNPIDGDIRPQVQSNGMVMAQGYMQGQWWDMSKNTFTHVQPGFSLPAVAKSVEGDTAYMREDKTLWIFGDGQWNSQSAAHYIHAGDHMPPAAQKNDIVYILEGTTLYKTAIYDGANYVFSPSYSTIEAGDPMPAFPMNGDTVVTVDNKVITKISVFTHYQWVDRDLSPSSVITGVSNGGAMPATPKENDVVFQQGAGTTKAHAVTRYNGTAWEEFPAVISDNAVVGGHTLKNIVYCTDAEYNASSKDASTLYLVKE